MAINSILADVFIWYSLINPILKNILILYPMKTHENLRFSGVFRVYKMGLLVIGLILLYYLTIIEDKEKV